MGINNRDGIFGAEDSFRLFKGGSSLRINRFSIVDDVEGVFVILTITRNCHKMSKLEKFCIFSFFLFRWSIHHETEWI